ncbi:unnamed protein product [Bursaphelenchus xylophilus]|uniref:(pine wood nematode) hypothetical protein n=1 Tax=Bursaphelenchus xylophilus TaxID=6326 RepID=A0A1I7RMR3_BURXY|nr:unnamed protein product [Bursaphelenchus xylophilus]CAG9125557.1 unnamed protein product [Bursaphelenchus xylophilus]
MNLFPSKVTEKCEVLELKENVRIENVLKKALKHFDDEGKNLLIYGSNKGIEKVVALTEKIKQNQKDPIYQWNKFSEIRVKAENKLDVDSFEPVMAVVLSKAKFEEESESIQISTESVDFPPFPGLQRQKIGAENKDNNWRQKRKNK